MRAERSWVTSQRPLPFLGKFNGYTTSMKLVPIQGPDCPPGQSSTFKDTKSVIFAFALALAARVVGDFGFDVALAAG